MQSGLINQTVKVDDRKSAWKHCLSLTKVKNNLTRNVWGVRVFIVSQFKACEQKGVSFISLKVGDTTSKL